MVDMHLLQTGVSLNLKMRARFQIQTSLRLEPNSEHGRLVTDFYSGSGTTADEPTKSAMLAGAHAAYELKKNIMSTGVCVGIWGRASKLPQECRQDA